MSTELESRLNDLEARLRRQQWLSMISLCLPVAAICRTWQSARPGAAGRSTLEATRFVLRDAAGKERGVWEVD